MFGVDISEIAKNNFKSYNFKDDSIYYGEVQHIDDEGNIIQDIEKISDEKLRLLKLVRHGYGVQLYGVKDNNCLCKYEGQWMKDIKQGKGICYFSDKSIYEGSLINSLFHGLGKFTWPNNDIYIGEWNKGKMEGEGEFKHNDGHILKGQFKNNYFLDQDSTKGSMSFVNPFLEQSSLQLVKNSIKLSGFSISTMKQKLPDDYFNQINIKETDFLNRIIESIHEDNKTPLILKNLTLTKKDIITAIEASTKTRVIEVDLRKFHSEVEGAQYDLRKIKELEKIIEICIFSGAVLFLNLDDNLSYDKLFDPDISNYYKKMQLSPLMFTPKDFKNPDNFKKFTKQEKIKKDKQINPSFKFVIYSRFFIGDGLSTQEEEVLGEKTNITLEDSSADKKIKSIRLLIESRFRFFFNLKDVKVILLKDN